jgi:hypothetical protein
MKAPPSELNADGMGVVMATLSELVEVIAEVEGIDRATVALIGRYVREAGLIVKRGRGPSAAVMGLTDAANLLIAVNATRNAAQAADAVSSFRPLACNNNERLPYSERARDFTFGEAIEQLIAAAGTGELPNPFLGTRHWDELAELFGTGQIHIEVRFRTTEPSALLKIAPLFEGLSAFPEIVAGLSPSIIEVFSPRNPLGQNQNGDRLEETIIGYRTLKAVGQLICPPAE